MRGNEMTAAGSTSPLPIGGSISRGWQAFTRAPWVFVGFNLLSFFLAFLTSYIQDFGSSLIDQSGIFSLFFLLLAIAGFCLGVAVLLWTQIGLFRGSWVAVSGRKPKWGDFIRWDFRATKRLFLTTLFLSVIWALVASTSILSFLLFSMISIEVGLLFILAGTLVWAYISTTQIFYLPITLAQGKGPINTFTTGRSKVDPQFFIVLFFGLIIVSAYVIPLFLFSSGAYFNNPFVMILGLSIFIFMPWLSCTFVAAYQHLFGSDDRTGFLNSH